MKGQALLGDSSGRAVLSCHEHYAGERRRHPGRIGTALADPTRRRILTMLLVAPAYPAELAQVLDVSRAKTSNHLACLRGCGLVMATREGRQVRYELADDRLAGALRELARVVLDSPACPAHLEPGP